MSKPIKNKIAKKNAYALVHDVIMIAIGIAIAVVLVRTGVLDHAIDSIKGYYIVASFISGIFFTSAFTLAPASIALVHIARNSPISEVVFWGGLGAMCGDLILFHFIHDRLATDIMKLMKPKTVRYIMRSLHFGFMKWLSPLLGILIIASPVPDEFAITLLGMSKVKTIILIPISFVMNMIGIYFLIQFAQLLK